MYIKRKCYNNIDHYVVRNTNVVRAFDAKSILQFMFVRDRYRHFRDEVYTKIGNLTQQQAGQMRIGDLDSVQYIRR